MILSKSIKNYHINVRLNNRVNWQEVKRIKEWYTQEKLKVIMEARLIDFCKKIITTGIKSVAKLRKSRITAYILNNM